MYLEQLSLTAFRNITHSELVFSPGLNVLYGNNGSGKSNILEAVFNLCLGRSQRRATDAVMLNQDDDTYRLTGGVHTKVGQVNESLIEVAVAYQSGSRKKITLDGVTIRVRELYQRFAAVAMGPEDAEIIAGSPSARRLFMDMYLSQMSAKYLSDLADYQKAIAQKNAALKDRMDASMFDQIVIDLGSRIMAERAKFVRQLNEIAPETYGEIADGEPMFVAYSPNVELEAGVCERHEIAECFSNAIDENASKEMILQTSIVGPHRDDLEFNIRGLAARQFGSQGQLRSAVVALKLAVLKVLQNVKNDSPILLLDEIFAELDQDRASRLVTTLANGNQVFLTTALERVDYGTNEVKRFRVTNGTVEVQG